MRGPCELFGFHCPDNAILYKYGDISLEYGKNGILARDRGITFEEIVQRIESGAKVIETDHPNKKSIQIKKY